MKIQTRTLLAIPLFGLTSILSIAQAACPTNELRSSCRDRYAADRSLKSSDRQLVLDLLTELDTPSMGSGLRWFRTTFSEESSAFKTVTDEVMNLKLPHVPARKAARRTHDAIIAAYDQGAFCPPGGKLLTFKQARELVVSKVRP